MQTFEFSPNPLIQELLALDSEIVDLAEIAGVLGWDQEVNMPPKAALARAKQGSTLVGIIHDRAVNPKINELLEQLEIQFKSDPSQFSEADKNLIRQIRRDYDLSTKLPKKLVQELSEATSLGQQKWVEAKNENDFKIFQGSLERIVELKLEEADALGYVKSPYDALLDLYEPGVTQEWLQNIFTPLKNETINLLKKIQSKDGFVSDEILHGDFDEEKQRLFNREVASWLGIDWGASRLDVSSHPFTTSLGGSTDVRITTRMNRDDITYSLMSVIHETGHAVYEQNCNPNLNRTSLFGGTSLGIHESQSRFFENRIGRSHAFWHYWYPKLREFFPDQFDMSGENDFYRAINKVVPSLIRVQADEVTYNLHIIIRFEIESDLMHRKIAVPDLPEVWSSKYKQYLGIEPTNDKDGVLQDIHWSHGSIGYFPTYTLGNLYGAQLANKMNQHVRIDEQLLNGDYSVILSWLKESIHQWGKMYRPIELIQRVTGEELNSKYFIDYLITKYSQIYELS